MVPKLPKESEKDYVLFMKMCEQPEYNLVKFCLLNKLSLARIAAIEAKNSWNKRYMDYKEQEFQAYSQKRKELLESLAQTDSQQEQLLKSVVYKLILESLAKHALQQQNPKHNIKIQDIEKLNNIYKSISTQEQPKDDESLENLSDEELSQLQDILKGNK